MKRWENELIFTKLFFVTTVILSVLAGRASAATITVKQLGGGDYTTISAAITNAQQDDTIMVYPGRYEEAVVINKNLTLIGSAPQITTIYSPSDGIEIQQGSTATIIGFTITSSKNGIYIKSNSNAYIKNNIIVSNGEYGVNIESNTTTSFINNIVSYNTRSGFIFRNVNPSIMNNIVTNNGEYGLYYWNTYGCFSYVISYNNVYSNISGNYKCTPTDTGGISQNPLFIDPSSGNFALQSASPSKDAGRPGSADSDPDGTRNDMGAYGGPDAASFWPYPPGAPIITSLTATPTSIPQGSPITINATGEIQ